MKQHKASRRTGSSKTASRAGAPRQTSARKAAPSKLAPRKQVAKAASRAGNSARQASPKAAVAKQAPAQPTGLVKLPAECLISSLDGLRTQLVERLAIETPVSLDASALERFDTAGLQLLAAFMRDRRAAGRPVEWTSVPASLTEAASLLNLTAVLGLDAAGESLKVAA